MASRTSVAVAQGAIAGELVHSNSCLGTGQIAGIGPPVRVVEAAAQTRCLVQATDNSLSLTADRHFPTGASALGLVLSLVFLQDLIPQLAMTPKLANCVQKRSASGREQFLDIEPIID